MACKAGCGLDLDFVHDVFQIWRMEVLPIILILVNVMIIIVVLSSVWTITMISWSSSMLTKWSARKGMEAEGGFEKRDFFEKHSPISSSVTPASNSVISSNFRSNILLFNIHQLQNIFFNIHQAENIFFNIHQAQPTYLHDLVAQNGKAWMYSGWGWKPDSLATLWRNRCAKLQLCDSMKVLKYDHCIVFWYSQAVIDINFKEHWYGHIKLDNQLTVW